MFLTLGLVLERAAQLQMVEDFFARWAPSKEGQSFSNAFHSFVTTEEFEKRAAEAPSLLSAGFVGLQKILDPATAKAIIAQEDFKEGRFDVKQAKGDGPEAGDEEEDGSRQEQ